MPLASNKFLKEKLLNRLSFYEECTAASLGNLLDSCFKKKGFRLSSNSDQGEKILENELAHKCGALYPIQEVETSAPKNNQDKQNHIKFLDEKILNKTKTSRSDPIIKLSQYFEHENVAKNVDPLKFWIEVLELTKCALQYFNIPEKSKNAERIFRRDQLFTIGDQV